VHATWHRNPARRSSHSSHWSHASHGRDGRAHSSLGQRIRITDSTGTKWYVWDGLDILLEHDGSGTLLRRYTHGHTAIPGVGSLIAVEDAEGNVYFYHVDQVGGVHRLTDIAQAVAKLYEFEPFGRMLQETGSAPNEFVFPANTLCLGALPRVCIGFKRTYDARLGRWTSRDVLRLLAYYEFTACNPLSFLDPDSRAPQAATARDVAEEYDRRTRRPPAATPAPGAAIPTVPAAPGAPRGHVPGGTTVTVIGGQEDKDYAQWRKAWEKLPPQIKGRLLPQRPWKDEDLPSLVDDVLKGYGTSNCIDTLNLVVHGGYLETRDGTVYLGAKLNHHGGPSGAEVISALSDPEQLRKLREKLCEHAIVNLCACMPKDEDVAAYSSLIRLADKLEREVWFCHKGKVTRPCVCHGTWTRVPRRSRR